MCRYIAFTHGVIFSSGFRPVGSRDDSLHRSKHNLAHCAKNFDLCAYRCRDVGLRPPKPHKKIWAVAFPLTYYLTLTAKLMSGSNSKVSGGQKMLYGPPLSACLSLVAIAGRTPELWEKVRVSRQLITPGHAPRHQVTNDQTIQRHWRWRLKVYFDAIFSVFRGRSALSIICSKSKIG